MKKPVFARAVVVVCLLLSIVGGGLSGGYCAEGMWLPNEIPDEIMLEMQSMGLALRGAEIWNASGTGIANAVVSVGASGSFVSPDGLILTNHHVAYGAVQRISLPEKNYIEEGFLARTRAEEVPAHGYIAYLLLSSEDVTPRVLGAVTPSMTAMERYDAIEAVTKEIVREAEEARDVYCEVNAFFGGARYRLDTYLKITDVRVVYVPSRSIGEYGGDIDNWMWPRHAGDFSFLRAYVGPDGRPAEFSQANVPYKPGSYLRVAPEGLSEGDFALILGFPRSTNRYLTSHALEYHRDVVYPERIRLYKRMLEILDAQSGIDPAGAIRVASHVKGINNRLKNNLGMLDGFKAFNLVEHQRKKEQEISAGLEGRPEMRGKYTELLENFRLLYDDMRANEKKDLLLDFMVEGSNLLGQAMRIYKWSLERQKPDMERDPDFMDRQIPYHKMRLRVFQMGYHEQSDRGLLEMFLGELASLPENRGREVAEIAVGHEVGPGFGEGLQTFLDEAYADTKLDRTEERLRMSGMSHDDLMAEGDAFIELAARLYEVNEERLERDKRFEGELQRIVPEWIGVVAEGTKGPLYSDANGTMRLNYGVVEGYSPVEGIVHEPFTRLSEIPEKDTGVPPFDAPQRLLDLAGGKYAGSAGREPGDIPVNLLTTNDSTGGNSGSPVLNAKGELVGCLFDGNYEAMTADFVFQDDITRSISVDIRYILFVAEYVDGAANLLRELGVD